MMTRRRGRMIAQKMIYKRPAVYAVNWLQRSYRISRVTLFLQRDGKCYHDHHPSARKKTEKSIP